MPHTAYDDDELGLPAGWDEHLDANIRKEIRNGRIRDRELAAAREERDRLEAEVLIFRSGIPAGPRADVVAKTFEGDRKDPEAVKAYYEELFGSVEGPGGAPPGGPGPPSLDGQRRIADAGAAGDNAGGTPGTVDLNEAMRNAKNMDELRSLIKWAQDNPQAFAPGTLIPRLPEDV